MMGKSSVLTVYSMGDSVFKGDLFFTAVFYKTTTTVNNLLFSQTLTLVFTILFYVFSTLHILIPDLFLLGLYTLSTRLTTTTTFNINKGLSSEA